MHALELLRHGRDDLGRHDLAVLGQRKEFCTGNAEPFADVQGTREVVAQLVLEFFHLDSAFRHHVRECLETQGHALVGEAEDGPSLRHGRRVAAQARLRENRVLGGG